MNTFLQHVAQDIHTKFPDGLSDVALVFPNKRASLFFNQELYGVVRKPIWTPAYITISDLFRNHSPLKVPDQELLIFKLFNLYTELTASNEQLDHFYSWGQLMLSDFDDIDKNMADATKLFINLEAWQEMPDYSFLSQEQREALEQFFGKVMDDTALQKQLRDIWRHLGPLYQEYRETLKREGLAYEGMLYRSVAERTESIDFRYSHYIFIGFNLLQKVERRLFDVLKDRGMASFYWDYDHYYLNPGGKHTDHEAGRHIARYLDRYPNELSRERISKVLCHDNIYDNMAHPKRVTFASAPTENIQARYVAEWLKQNGNDGKRTAIVLGDEKLLEQVVHCLPDDITDFNITTGFPLSSSPVTTLVVALINLQLYGRSGKDGYRLKYINPILRHPYAYLLSEQCSTLSERLNEKHRNFPNRDELTMDSDEAIALLFAPLDEADGILPWLPWIASLLKQIGLRSRETNDALIQESVFRMYKLINRLNNILVPISADAATSAPATDPQGRQLVSTTILQRLLTQIIQSTSIPFHGEPLHGIQIMGVLETRNLDFDNVLVLSCNEGNLPKGVNDASFIPHSIRAGYELTTVENKVATYSYYFHVLLQRAGNITLTFCNATDDGQKGEMSRFMLQYMVERPATHSLTHITLQAGESATQVMRHNIAKDDGVMQHLLDLKTLSPSAISRYQRCQLQFYYNTVCRLREADNDDEDVDNIMFGNIFHRAAELTYKSLSHDYAHTIARENIAALLKNNDELDQFVDQAFSEQLFKQADHSQSPRYNGIQMFNRKIIHHFLRQLLKLDEQLAPISIKGLEINVHDNLTIQVDGKPHQLRVGGQIDRLDQICKNGQTRLRVVDYKTGTPLKSFPASMDEVFDSKLVDSKHATYYLQAFLYADIVRYSEEERTKYNAEGHAVSPALYFIRQAAGEDYDPTLVLAPDRGKRVAVNDIAELHDEFRSKLTMLLEDIFDREKPFEATIYRERCARCPYQNICGL